MNYCSVSKLLDNICYKKSYSTIIRKSINVSKFISNYTNRHFIKKDNDYLLSSFGYEIVVNNLLDINNDYLFNDDNKYLLGYYYGLSYSDIYTFIKDITPLERSILRYIKNNTHENEYYRIGYNLKKFYLENFFLFD